MNTTHTITLTAIECCACAMIFGLPRGFERERRRDHTTWYCPAGHKQYFSGESDLERAARERDVAQHRAQMAHASASAARDQRDAANRSAASYKGHLTRARKRFFAGICPVAGCKRHFPNLAAHMATQHPQEAEALDV